MEKLVIERNKWLRGNSGVVNFLWNDTYDAGCCLGHLCHKLRNFSINEIKFKSTPADLIKPIEKLTRPKSMLSILEIDNSILSDRAIEINDNKDIDEETREKELINLFAKYDIELEFVGKDKQST